MRTVAEALNEYLLKRNMKNASRVRQAVGLLTLGVVRSNRLYLSQCGSGHAYLIADERAKQLYDPQEAGRGLGLSRATNIRYHQAQLYPGDVLLISTDPPLKWNTTSLRNLYGMSLRELQQRLTQRPEGELDAVLMLAQAGSGQVQVLQALPTHNTEKPAPDGKTARRESEPPPQRVTPSQQHEHSGWQLPHEGVFCPNGSEAPERTCFVGTRGSQRRARASAAPRLGEQRSHEPDGVLASCW